MLDMVGSLAFTALALVLVHLGADGPGAILALLSISSIAIAFFCSLFYGLTSGYDVAVNVGSGTWSAVLFAAMMIAIGVAAILGVAAIAVRVMA